MSTVRKNTLSVNDDDDDDYCYSTVFRCLMPLSVRMSKGSCQLSCRHFVPIDSEKKFGSGCFGKFGHSSPGVVHFQVDQQK